ncbi:hypothetical protein M3I54_43930 [Paraburkholderia sp. CNPSo 3274]|uniref:hypothetical protein n=1 Tax=Paraburkholderia sp. CNPSo 3274 TaxID=2940932 RepID=UPI0020B673BA|nr:hypothetical protein [Paraburkholderia sp. CNPSo 3274]MCP3713688.1 hypothetical protein [Paraburkholderia sp. CNPSo 3274]
MARKSKADRINDILRLNPSLNRDDPRIDELIYAETALRKAQLAAQRAEVLTVTAAGNARRNPALIEVDSANTRVRRLRNELGIDRLNVKRNEAAGIKIKRTTEADKLLGSFGPDYNEDRVLLPGLAALLAAHGITAADMPDHSREAFEQDLAEQADQVDAVRDRIKRLGA